MMSDNLKVGDFVRIRETNDEGEPLFVGELDLASCVGRVFIVTSISPHHMDYPIFCRAHPMYLGTVPNSIKNGICLKHKELELLDPTPEVS